jgi:hypothetical protein
MENNSYKTKTEKDLRVTYIYKKDAKNFKNSKNPRIVENKKSKLQVIQILSLLFYHLKLKFLQFHIFS